MLNLNVIRTRLKEPIETWVLFVWDVAEKDYEKSGLFFLGPWVKEWGDFWKAYPLGPQVNTVDG